MKEPCSDLALFIARGSERITPLIIQGLLHKLPMLKAEFTQIKAPQQPHLVDQLEFLADVVEDVADGSYGIMPYHALADATFALLYAHQALDIIPDTLPDMGRADDSAVVRHVLMRHEGSFRSYADSRAISWSSIGLKP